MIVTGLSIARGGVSIQGDNSHNNTRRPAVVRETGRTGKGPLRAVWFAVGLAAVLLAALGVVLPLLPTTPFLLVAVYAFARSSDRWHAWLHSNPVFAPLIRDWRRYRAISRRAKIVAVASMAVGVSPTILAVQAVVLSASAVFVLSRSSPPER